MMPIQMNALRGSAALLAYAFILAASTAVAQPSPQALQEAWAAHQARLQAELPGLARACGPGDDSRYREARNLVYAGEDAVVRSKIEELRPRTEPHLVYWRCAFEHALATGASQPRDPALQSGTKAITIKTVPLFRKPDPAAAPAPSRGPAGSAGQFASSCVRLLRSGPNADGNWRFLNECGTDVSIFWCFIPPDRNGQCGYKGSWNVAAGRGWTTHSKDTIRWGACRGLNTGGLVGNDGATFHCGAMGAQAIAGRTPPLGGEWTPDAPAGGGVAAGAQQPPSSPASARLPAPQGAPAAAAARQSASFQEAGCQPDEAAMQSYINEHNAIAPSVGFQQMDRSGFMDRVWKSLGSMQFNLSRLEEFTQQSRKSEEFNRGRIGSHFLARREMARELLVQRGYACLMAYRDAQRSAPQPVAAATRPGASGGGTAGEVQCERGFEELNRRTQEANARLPQNGARPGLELIMWSTREAMQLIDANCAGSARYRSEREAYRQRYAEAERSCGQLSNTGSCEPRLP